MNHKINDKQTVIKKFTSSHRSYQQFNYLRAHKVKMKNNCQKDSSFSDSIPGRKHFWNSFPNCEKSYILTSDSQCSLNFTFYQASGYLIEDEFKIENIYLRYMPKIICILNSIHLLKTQVTLRTLTTNHLKNLTKLKQKPSTFFNTTSFLVRTVCTKRITRTPRRKQK
jgi:hypothetical protein